MPEMRYRASQICRALGNPTAYEIMHILVHEKTSPERLAYRLKKSLPAISKALRLLRELDLVTYGVAWRRHIYSVTREDIARVLNYCDRLAHDLKLRSL